MNLHRAAVLLAATVALSAAADVQPSKLPPPPVRDLVGGVAPAARPEGPDYRFAAIPFSLSSWDSSSWAVEGKVSGLVRAEGRRLVLTFGEPALLRAVPMGKDKPPRITGVRFLLVVDGKTSFNSRSTTELVPVGTTLPASGESFEVELPEEMTLEIGSEARGVLAPGLANTFLKMEIVMPGRDDKGVERAEWATCYADSSKTLFADRLVPGGHAAVCAKANTMRLALDWKCHGRVQDLVAAGANPHELESPPPTGAKRDTPLEEAVRAGDTNAVRTLLAAGADPNRVTHTYSPFELAATEGRVDLLEAMLRFGARRDAVGAHGYTPLMLAVHFNHPDAVRFLLRSGVDPNQQVPSQDPFWNGQTPLMHALRADQSEVRRLLFDAGANPARSMPNGFTALLLAAEQPGLDAFRFFLERGLRANAPGDRGYFAGITPFMSTAVRSDVKNMEEMLALGADPRLKDREGRDALYWAKHFKRDENAAWLERRLRTQ
ncbi:hypothetical protein BWI17_10915 [Betaproteobacteria bacterium GR16-43]|nr:hypothetical protein BWI17_10915 [Betaproteobacteria bacterium GR16-43]